MKLGMADQMRLSGMIAVVLPLIIFLLLRQLGKKKNANQLWTVLLMLYTFGILYETILKKSVGDYSLLNLKLFWSYQYWDKAAFRWQIYMNVFLFIPFGFFLRRPLMKTLILALIYSSIIETAQYLFHLGLCELDDVFHNTLGAVIGCLYYRGMVCLTSRLRHN